jgi:NADH-quinone oxidoreductase subunit E
MMSHNKTILPEQVCTEIDRWLTKYPPHGKQSALLPALLIAQENHDNWLSNEIIEAVADYLGIPHIAAYEVASFYSMYNLKPVGKNTISVCTNISCMLSGSEKIERYLKQRLGVKFGETTADGKYTIKEVECLAACAGAPACLINKTYHENVTPEKLDAILRQLEEVDHA